uniref:ARAD1C24948p n=1 Tax=Blastobotrys adeninivorans TaxID=409370 RepID=A0A060T7V2_BLAAD
MMLWNRSFIPRASINLPSQCVRTQVRQVSTIYALSTHPGKAAVAIVRVSGPLAPSVFSALTGLPTAPQPRRAQLVSLYNHQSLLDRALALYFKAPFSYTGEDVLELHLHGGQAIVKAVMDTIGRLELSDSSANSGPGRDSKVRYAEAGEFTRRAFANGRLDLTEVEGIRDMIDAETEFQRQAAVASAGGQMRELYDKWRDEIVHQSALLTALIDFSDDNADIDGNLFDTVKKNVTQLLQQIRGHRDQISRSELLQAGIKLNLLGPPNAGKSSLLNILARREVAIVSDVAGTTRDVVEVGLDINGYKVVIGDTAGLRVLESIKVNDDHSKIELEGMRRARERFKVGDLVVAVIPTETTGQGDVVVAPGIKEELHSLSSQRIIVALNKIDTVDEVTKSEIIEKYSKALDIPCKDIVPVSCTTGEGVELLVHSLATECQQLTHSSYGPPIGASQRIRDLLDNDVIGGLEAFLSSDDVVMATSELQFAIDGIGKITGRGVGIEEVLGVVFSSFCIGK